MLGNAHRPVRSAARLMGSAVLEVRILTGRGAVRLGDATYQDWLTKRTLIASDEAHILAATDRFLAELGPYFVTETMTTREALRLYFAERPGDLRAVLFGMAA
jgi:hypothetical protein